MSRGVTRHQLESYITKWEAQKQGEPCFQCGHVVNYWKCLYTVKCYLDIFWAKKEYQKLMEMGHAE